MERFLAGMAEAERARPDAFVYKNFQ